MNIKLYYYALLMCLIQASDILSDTGVGCSAPMDPFTHEQACNDPNLRWTFSVGADNKTYNSTQIYSLSNIDDARRPNKVATGIYSTDVWGGRVDGLPSTSKPPHAALFPHPTEERFAFGNLPSPEIYQDGNPLYNWADPLRLMRRSLTNPADPNTLTYYPEPNILPITFKVRNATKLPAYVGLYYITANVTDTTVGSDKILQVPQLLVDSNGNTKDTASTPLATTKVFNVTVPVVHSNTVDTKASAIYTFAPGEVKSISFTPDPSMVACKTFLDNSGAGGWYGCCDCLFADIALVASSNKNKLTEFITKNKFGIVSKDKDLDLVKVAGSMSGGTEYNLYTNIPSVLRIKQPKGGQLAWDLDEPTAPSKSKSASESADASVDTSAEETQPVSQPTQKKAKSIKAVKSSGLSASKVTEASGA